MVCCKEGYEELAKYLLNAGASTEGNFGITPIQLAQQNGHDTLVLAMTNIFQVPLRRPMSNQRLTRTQPQSQQPQVINNKQK